MNRSIITQEEMINICNKTQQLGASLTVHALCSAHRVLLALLLLTTGAGSACADTWDGTITNNANNKFAENGITLRVSEQPNSESNPYTIDNAREFAYFMRIVHEKWTGYSSAYYWELTADIDLNNIAWAHGSNTGNSFQGHFNGANHTVSNVKLDVTTNSNYGLFPTIQGTSATSLAEVKNLNISGVTFTSDASRGGNTRIGALAGYVKQANITNVNVSGVTFTYTSKGSVTGTNQLGGAIGCMENNTTLDDVDVTGVSASFDNTTTKLYLGGVVGQSGGTQNTNSITNCDVKSIKITHSSNITGETQFGGLVGQANTSLSTISNNTVEGQVGVNGGKGFDVSVAGTTASLSVGGLLGYATGNASSTISVTGCHAYDFYISHTGAVSSANIGGLIGNMSNYVSVTSSNAKGVNATFDNTTTSLYLGGLVGQSSGGTANTNSVTGNTVNTVKVTHSNNITGTTYMGGLVGNANANLSVINNNTVAGVAEKNDGKAFDVSVSGTTVNFYAGGLLGYTKGDGHEVKGNSVEKVYITNTGTINGGRLGGFIGYVESDNTTSKILVKGNTATTVNIRVDGNTVGTPYLGGFIGQAKGKASPDNRTVIEGNTVTSPTVTMNGVVGHGFYMGGFLGYADAQTNLYNNKVKTPNLTIANDINAETYVGGAVGRQANYTTIDGMTVDGGYINGPSSVKTVKNNTAFFVGGFIGQQNSSGTVAYQPNVFRNIAVTDININLEKYQPATTITNHKFAVGGIAGCVNAPNKDANGFCGMPENIIFKGGKIYAPYATTSPTVSNFNASNPSHNTMTTEVVTTIDALDKAKTKTWYYSDYELGLSSAITGSGGVVIADNATTAKDKFHKNYTSSATITVRGGISYLTVNNSTFQKSNRFQDSERDSKTVLWWTNTAGYSATGASADMFTNEEQPIFPHQAGASPIPAATSFPYYWYFFQGVSNANYVSSDVATKIIKGIAGNKTEAAKDHPITLTISNPNENERGFDQRTISVVAKTTDNDGNVVDATTGITSYQWYVNGVADGTSTSINLTPHWKDGQGITVNALNGETVVATATYTLAPGVLKTKTGSSEKIRSDINARGTKANPYIIDCENALRQWSYLSTVQTGTLWEGLVKPVAPFPTNQIAGHYGRAYYELGADITMGSEPFIPISHVGYGSDGTWGTFSNNFSFQGNFDGKGHKISGLKITWGAGQYKGNDANIYHGLFGLVGHSAATAKWGDGKTTPNTVIQNLVIENATLTHDVSNTTFSYKKSYSHFPTADNYNNCMVGVLAGVVAANTTVQNIEIRGSKITDEGSCDYSLATKGLFVGGAIGSVQAQYNKTDIPTNTVIKNIVVGTDIDLTHAMIQDLAFAQQGAYNVGGIIGRFASTNGDYASTQAVMPKYLLYTGSIKACYTAANGKKDALISPVIAATRYSSNQSISDKNISKIWEGNNNDKEQLTVADALYYNFKISDASGEMHLVTEDYPNKVCSQGARAQDTHTDGLETAAGYLGQRYQGVNYNAIFCDAATYDEDADGGKRMAVAILNSHNDVDVYWEWTPGDATPHMTNIPTAGAYIVRDAETADKYNVVGTAATAGKYYKWYVGGVLQDEHSSSITVAADISDSYIKAEVYDNSSAGSPIATTQYLVIKGEFKVNTSISKNGDTYTVGLDRGGVDLTTNTLGDRIVVTYQWYKGNAVNVNTATALGSTTKSINITQEQLGEVNNLFCHVTISTTGAYSKVLFTGDISQYVREANVVYLQLQDTFTDSEGVTHNKPATSGAGTVDDPVTSWANAYAKLNGYTEPTQEYVTVHGGTWTSATDFDDETYYLAHKDEYLYDTYKREGNKRKVKPIDQCTNNWNNNIIVLMGLSTDGYFNTGETSQHNIDGARANKPVTITGQWDGTNYYGYLSNLSGDFSINADHKFENMGLGVLDKGIGATESIRYRIYAHRWNVHAGKGLLMGWAAALEWGIEQTDANKKIYKITSADVSTGTPVGKYACDIAIMGGYLNDNTSTNPEMFEYINHGRDDIGQQIKIESGFWGPVCPGNRQTDSGNTITTYYTMGGPDHPAKTIITVDIDREWNDKSNHNQFNSAMSPATVDVGCLLTGNHEGTMYADVALDIRSGNMGRIVNGIKGAQRRQIKNPGSFTTNGHYRHTVKYGTTWTKIAAPAPDSYFGRGILNFDPSISENNAGAGNAGVNVVELYCGGLGRGHNDGSYHPEVRSYFYGLCEVNIKGGTFQKTIYGSGAGGTNGIGTATNHTDDDGLPYWNTDLDVADANGAKHVWYAPYEYIKNEHSYDFVKVKITGTGSDDENLEGGYVNLEKTRNIINITGGIFGSEEKPVSIYAGGNGETDAALINPSSTKVGDVKNTYNTPNHQAGNMYGAADGLTTEINISGDAKIYGSIFGGGRGTMRYYRYFLRAADNVVAYNADNQEYTRIWNPSSSANGDYNKANGKDWQNIINSRKNADRYLNLGQVYGNTKVSISGNVEILGNVYGGGEGVSDITLSELIKTADSEFGLGSNQTKLEVAALKGSLAGDKRSAHVDLSAADDSYVNFPNMGKIFGNAAVEISGDVTIHGNVYGGGKAGAIQGTTNVDVKGNVNIFGEVYGAGQGLLVDKSKDYKQVATIIGDATVNLSENAYIWQDMFGGGENAVVDGDTHFNMSGGHVAANVFGGGKGDIKKNNEGTAYEYVNDKLVITSADISGNTNVDITGGEIVWDRTSMAEASSHSVTYHTFRKRTGTDEDGNDVYDVKTFTDDDLAKEGKTIEQKKSELSDYEYSSKTEESELIKGEIVYWDPTNQSLADNTVVEGKKYYNSLFYDTEKQQFKIKHNIFGGGYVACRVGTYNASGELQNKKDALNADLTDDEGNVIPTGRARVSMVSGMFGADLMKTEQWKLAYNDNQDPHFYVFGGGFGAYTSVGKTQVQIGVNEEILEAAGETDEQWAKPGHLTHREWTDSQRAKSSKFNAAEKPEDETEIGIADQSYGEPGFTILGILGGGYAGIVTGNTDVRVGGNTFMHRIYGGGYGQLAAYNELKDGDNICVGIGTFNNNREDLGMVMGDTYVKTDGGFVQGDVFGGGAGVEWDDIADHDFTMGEVKGATEVEITGETFVQRSVYGGGDVANVLGGTVDTDDENAPQQTSTVTVKSGTVVANVFGGGNGRLVSQVHTKEDDGKAVTVGAIFGNTLVTIEDTKNEETGEIISSPDIYGDIYGGCGYGQIKVHSTLAKGAGNTVVNINGGNIGGNVYGGGLGKEAESNTSANIAGSTNVTINGGSALWDKISDDNGNVSKWDVVENILTTDAERTAVRLALVTGDTQIFKTLLAGKVSDKFFDVEKLEYTKNHNIYGGGDRVCKVAGTANVTVNHALVTDATILNPNNTAGLCWAASIDNKEHPQFSVFGGGYGPNTTVANTEVKYQCGHNADDYTYESQEADRKYWLYYFGGLAQNWGNLDSKDKDENYGGDNAAGIWRYAVSQLAWSSGIPNLIMRGVFGGGYAGLVSGNTDVTVSDASCLRYVYGGGLGSKDYLDKYDKAVATNLYNRLGEVAGNSTVTISGGVVSKEVYGGGAGIEPKKLGEDTDFTDLVDMARVKGKTSVIISGSPSITEEGANGTVIIGDVFGGGDVANVGMEDATITGTNPNDEDFVTSKVIINSGCMLGQVFAGGNGRTKDICSGEDANHVFGYQKVGAIYGNTLLTVNGYDDSSSDGQGGSHDNITYVFKRMFGGGNNGSIRQTTASAANSGHTYVTVNGGYFAYNVFGGGVGTINTTVNEETGETIDNNTYSYVEGSTHVKMLGGLAIVDQYWDKPQTIQITPDKSIEVGLRQWAPLNEKDGKKYSAQYDPEHKKLLINHNIYAGCRNAGYVLGNTYLTMNKGYIRSGLRAGAYEGVADNFFESQEWEEIYSKIGSPHFCIFGGGFGENTHIKGDTFVDIDIDAADPNLGLTSAEVLKETDHDKPAAQRFEGGQSVMDIIGGGYSGDVAGATHVKISNDVYARRIFGGSFYAPVSQTNIMINSINCDDIFGGGMMGDVRPTTVKGYTLASGCGNTNVVIGTPGATANDKIFINNNVYGGNDVSGEVTGQINASIFGGKIYNNVYGAGNGNYLYALNDKVEKVTTHEYYEANGQTYDLVYEVPLQARMDFNVKSATDAQKIVNINTYRPRAEKVILNLAGTSLQPLTIGGNVFGGGNTATVSSLSGNRPAVTMNIGSYCTIGGVYMGADGEAMFQEKSGFMGAFQNINGVDLTNPIDWVNNIANKSIGEEFLPVAKANRNKIYPHVLDLYFEPVEMSVQPTLNWCSGITLDSPTTLAVTPTVNAAGLTNTTIGTFVSGGNRGNMNVEPWNGTTANYGGNVEEAGQIVNYSFPAGLTIQNRIVGGCNNANYTLGKVTHEGGYLLGGRKHAGTEINLLVECQFAPQATEDQVAAAKGNSDKIAELSSGNVFGGCYKSGTIIGDVSIDVRSDMLKNVSTEVLKASKDNNVPVASVYGAGYGMESFVYGETEVLFGKETKSTVSAAPAKSMGGKKAAPATPTVIYGATAKDVYGGGQQGNLIGNSTIKVLNGHIAGSVVGGSYAGYMWGSTQVLVGYPKYYTVNKSSTYGLKRADKWNVGAGYKNADGSDAVKQTIKLIEGDIIAEEVYDAIYAQDASQTTSGQFTPHTMKPSVDSGSGIKWDDINIKIDDAAYGGGYSLASGSSVGSQTYTVLKYNDEHNLDADMTSDKLTAMGGSSKQYGGNTTVLVWDHAAASYDDGSTSDKEHIAISTQEMTEVNLPDGTDLFGYYYWDTTSSSYKYIFQEGKYKKGTTDGMDGDVKVYASAFKYDGDGGVYGDGHLSFAEGFRAGEVNGYGFAGSNPAGAKILNTFQRMDMLRVSDCSLVLLGACDYTVNEVSTTPYSIARVGELQMKSDNVVTDGTTLNGTDTNRSRNFIGLSNNIHYVGAVTSDIPFNANFHKNDGTVGTRTYREEKQDYVDKFYGKGDYNTSNEAYQQKGVFQRRNDGTAKNMIGIASGYAMKILNTKTTDSKGTEETFYGPIVGVVEIALTNTHADEAGAYVYAANLHRRDAATAASDPNFVPVPHVDDEDFLETTGNFVFPYNSTDNRYVIDDCYKTEYDAQGTKEHGYPIDAKAEAHYWYVAGWEYYYNAHITGYTYNDPNTFYAENDGSMTLVGTIANTEVKVESIKWRSLHADAEADELESRNTKPTNTPDNVDAAGNDVAGKYKLYIGTSNEKKYDAKTDNKPAAGAYYGADSKRVSLDFKTPGTVGNSDYSIVDQAMLGSTVGVEDNILIALQDDADNHGKDYFDAHFAEPCEATIVLSAPAKNSDGTVKYKYTADASVTSGSTIPADHYVYNETTGNYVLASGTAAPGISYFTKAEGRYTYTIYLTIDYVMGPTYTGNIQVENCALPGEMIKVSLGTLEIESDLSMPPFGHNWKFGPRTYDNETGKWTMDHEKAYTYKIGTPFDPEADSNETSEMLAGVKYNKDGNYIEVPAYYFMNGYGVEYNFKVTGINETDGNGNVVPKDFSVAMRDQDQLTVHNYHRMKPRNADGINRAPVDFHLDLAAERAANDASFAEPRIYIADASDLNELPRFLNEKAPLYYDLEAYNAGKPDAEKLTETQFAALPSVKKLTDSYDAIGSKYDFGNHMQFHLLNDIVVNNVGNSNLQADHYAEQGATDFKGTLNGNGYIVSDLGVKKGDFTPPTYLFAANQGNIYNLGLKQGVITKNDSGANNPLYHCSYTWSNKIVYRMDGTAVNTYTDNDWRYGKVTYDLNQYYLDHRKAVLHEVTEPHSILAKSDAPALRVTPSESEYVENLFANGDYLYARWQTASPEYLRTTASQYDANYNSLVTYHRYSLADGVLTHPVDESRAVYNESVFSHYSPLYEVAKQNSTLATSDVVKNDYLFFGQKLDDDTKAAALGGINITIPEHIDAAVTRNVALMNNRVYRAGGYYKSRANGEEPYATSGGSFFYNRAAYAHDNGITAIDYYGYPESATTWYSPMVDYPTARLASMDRAVGVTRNLLVYANNDDDVNEGALKPYVYDESTPEGNVKMHVIKPIVTPAVDPEPEKVVPTTAYLHLVERTANNKDASGAYCENNDFDAPIAFDVTQRAWYTRQPIYYAKNNNDAWEGIVLPFTATKVKASLNGDITHFYGTPTEAQLAAPETNDKTLHHEYWLRGLTGVATADSKTTATFLRPGDPESGLFGSSILSGSSYSNLASMSLVFSNTWFKETYGDLNYNWNDPSNQNKWYSESHTYENYKPLTADVPYIVSFPGDRYYEFDLSSQFYNDRVGDSMDPQTVTFSNDVTGGEPIHIKVSPAEMKTVVSGYQHKGIYLYTENVPYAMNANGTQFADEEHNTIDNDVRPFRTYMAANASNAKRIIIGGTSERVGGESVHGDPDEGLNTKSMVAYSVKRDIIIESDYATDVLIYNAAGQLVRAVKVYEGSNLYTGFAPGVYIVNGTKLSVR